VFLEAFAMYISLFVLFGEVLRRVAPSISLVAYLLSTLLLPLALVWPARRGKTVRDSRRGFCWHRGEGIVKERGCGVIGYITGLPIVAIALVITFFLSRFASASPSHPIMGELRGGVLEIGLIYLLACIWAPIMEETMFRGALFNHLRGRWGWLISSLVVGLLFALVHPQGWTAIPVLGSIGAVLASVREWRGSLIGPMTAHALNNATAVTAVLLLIR
jgi:membrane protease YdiL (CAAX protease family)